MTPTVATAAAAGPSSECTMAETSSSPAPAESPLVTCELRSTRRPDRTETFKVGSDHAFEHQHVHRVAWCHAALCMVQHDQAVGLHHGAEDAGALVAGGAHVQRAVGRGAHDAALVLGAAGLLAHGFLAVGAQQGRRCRVAAA